MDAKRHMLIVNGEIRTKEIKSCNYNRDTGKRDIVFYNSDKVYPYAYDSVIWLTAPEVMNHDVYRFYRNGNELTRIYIVYVFTGKGHNYYHIRFMNGSEASYKDTELEIVESCLTDAETSNVFEYIKQVSALRKSSLRTTKSLQPL